MLRKKLYVILSKGEATAEQIGTVLPQHLEYMIGLEKNGVLFASGPLSASPGAPVGDGLTILRAANAEEASSIASADPFVTNKLRSFEVREWTLMEGSFGVKVNFSGQSLDITDRPHRTKIGAAMETVGFIGVGKIGLPVCENLIKSGYKVLGYRRGSLADFEKA